MDDFYARLQIPPDASPDSIHHAYRRLAKTCHPDLHPGDAELTRKFILITEAYNTLCEPDLRAAYDAERAPAFAPIPPGAWTNPKPFGKTKAPHMADTGNPSPRKPEPLFTHEDAVDISMFILAIARSPITYCVIAAFLLLYGFKDLIDSITHPPHKP